MPFIKDKMQFFNLVYAYLILLGVGGLGFLVFICDGSEGGKNLAEMLEVETLRFHCVNLTVLVVTRREKCVDNALSNWIQIDLKVQVIA